MKRHWLLLLAAMVLGSFAFAQKGVGKGLGLGWIDPTVLKQQLGLTDEQVQKLTQLRTEHLTKVSQLGAELAAKRAELSALMWAPEPNQRRVQELTEQIAKLTTELVKERLNFQQEVRKILTPEQLRKLQQRWLTQPRRGLGMVPSWGCWWGRFGTGRQPFAPTPRFAPPAVPRPAPPWGGWGRRRGW